MLDDGRRRLRGDDLHGDHRRRFVEQLEAWDQELQLRVCEEAP